MASEGVKATDEERKDGNAFMKRLVLVAAQSL